MSTVFKFAVVGSWGFIVNTTVLIFGVRFGFRPSIAGPLGAELAIISNFILNNLWTFSDKTITSWNVIPGKFLQFNVLSLGSTIIQFLFLRVGETIFGLVKFKQPLVLPKIATWPVIKQIAPKFSLYMIIYMFAVGVGMVVNYVIYSQIIWK